MAGKSFEQRAREQMADLQMQPDAAIWPEIEAALQQTKKRRWLIWFFPLLAVCGGIGLWYYLQNDQPQQLVSAGNPAVLAKEKPNATTTPITGVSSQKQPNTSVKDDPKNEPIKNEFKIIDQPVIGRPGNHEKIRKTTAGTGVEKRDQTANGQMPTTIAIPGSVSKEVIDKPNPQQPAIADTFTAKNMTNRVTVTKNPAENITVVDSVPAIFPNMQASAAIPLNNVPAVESSSATIQINQKNKWAWHINAIAGNSDIRKALKFGSFTAEPPVFANVIPPGNTSSLSQAQAPYKTPTVTDAFSFSVDLEARKPVGKKHSIGISLGYGLYQNHIGIGRRIDSILPPNAFYVPNSNRYYYRSTDSIAYTSRYHFLQAAIAWYTPFRLFKTVALQWQVGAGANILLASNALQYSASNNVLFNDNSLLRTVLLDLSTGIDIVIGKPAFLAIGPQWQYFLGNLSVQPGSNQHFVRSSVKATIPLSKKEKKKMQR